VTAATRWPTSAGSTSGPTPGVLLLGVLTWTRLHGIISLEIEGLFDQMHIDPARLYSTEIDNLIAQRQGAAAATPQR
jgi:hypothetical protein